MEEKVANKGNNKKEKNKFQSGFKPQKGQKSDTNKDKGGGRAGTWSFSPAVPALFVYVTKYMFNILFSSSMEDWRGCQEVGSCQREERKNEEDEGKV